MAEINCYAEGYMKFTERIYGEMDGIQKAKVAILGDTVNIVLNIDDNPKNGQFRLFIKRKEFDRMIKLVEEAERLEAKNQKASVMVK